MSINTVISQHLTMLITEIVYVELLLMLLFFFHRDLFRWNRTTHNSVTALCTKTEALLANTNSYNVSKKKNDFEEDTPIVHRIKCKK